MLLTAFALFLSVAQRRFASINWRMHAKKGYQASQRIPQCAWEAYGELVRLGYNKYVLQ